MPPNQTLRKARMLRGWSQALVAQKIESSTKNISRWERGETIPSPYYRERLSQLFDMDVRSLGLLKPIEDDLFLNKEIFSPPTEQFIDPAVPPLQIDTELFTGRELVLRNLLQQVQPGNLITLYGLPGSGKTTLCQILTQDPQIQERFSDRILWIGLGLTPDIPRHMLRLARLLKLPSFVLEQEHTEEEWSRLLCDAFAEHHPLLILDDVWTARSALPFLAGGPSVASIITTRQPKVAFELAKQEPWTLSPLSNEASIHLLTKLATSLKQVDDALLQKIVQLTGGLPLSIVLIGRYLASHSYEGQLRRLEMALNQIADRGYRLNLSGTVPTIHYQNTSRYSTTSSLSAVISLSDHQLPPAARAALRAISILPTAPAYFSEEAASAVSAAKVEVLDLLVDMGLIQPAANYCYRIHHTIADYARHHLEGKAPQVRLVHYMKKTAVDHSTNAALLEREYATLLMGLDTAVMLQMQSEVVEGVLALIAFMQMHSFYTQADHYLRKALHAAISLQDLFLCQKILGELTRFAQLRRDTTQHACYQQIQQKLDIHHTDHSYIHIILHQIKIAIKEHIETPRHYIL